MSTVAAAPFDWKTLSSTSVASVKSELLPTSMNCPRLPYAVTEFVQKASSPNFDVKELAAIVEKDGALTVELLKHVNSAVYAMRNPVAMFGMQSCISASMQLECICWQSV